MKIILTALLTLLSFTANAQNNPWQTTAAPADAMANQKYLKGAVPMTDGRIVFATDIEAPGKTADQLYNIVLTMMEQLTHQPEQTEQSRVALADRDKHQIVGNMQEWLVFKNTPLVLDRTRLLYHLIADCRDGSVSLQMTRIIYIYDEERDPVTYRAEEWIDDHYGLNMKQTKLARVSGKFRSKTIDRKDYIFDTFKKQLTQP